MLWRNCARWAGGSGVNTSDPYSVCIMLNFLKKSDEGIKISFAQAVAFPVLVLGAYLLIVLTINQLSLVKTKLECADDFKHKVTELKNSGIVPPDAQIPPLGVVAGYDQELVMLRAMFPCLWHSSFSAQAHAMLSSTSFGGTILNQTAVFVGIVLLIGISTIMFARRRENGVIFLKNIKRNLLMGTVIYIVYNAIITILLVFEIAYMRDAPATQINSEVLSALYWVGVNMAVSLIALLGTFYVFTSFVKIHNNKQ